MSPSSESQQQDPRAAVKQSQALTDRAKKAAQIGNYGDAESLCQQALSLTPNHSESLYMLAVIKRSIGQYLDAE